MNEIVLCINCKHCKIVTYEHFSTDYHCLAKKQYSFVTGETEQLVLNCSAVNHDGKCHLYEEIERTVKI